MPRDEMRLIRQRNLMGHPETDNDQTRNRYVRGTDISAMEM